MRRRLSESVAESVKVKTPGDLAGRLIDGLAFELTGAQRRALDEIWVDLTGGRRMHRLLQGDVGSERRSSRCRGATDR